MPMTPYRLRTLLLAACLLADAALAGPLVQLDTTKGAIVIELDAERAPRTVENFLAYVKSDHYAGTIFHRVIDGFMIQGGGYTPTLEARPTRAPVALESRNGLSNVRGSIAMARTADPDSATSQFFINVVDNPRLDYPRPDGNGYAVFGKVVKGMEVVDAIKSVPTGTQGEFENVPTEPVVIEKATLLPDPAAPAQ